MNLEQAVLPCSLDMAARFHAGAYQMHAELPWVRPSDRRARISPDGLSIDILGLRQVARWTFLEGFWEIIVQVGNIRNR